MCKARPWSARGSGSASQRLTAGENAKAAPRSVGARPSPAYERTSQQTDVSGSTGPQMQGSVA
jgi:hypothetical protein